MKSILLSTLLVSSSVYAQEYVLAPISITASGYEQELAVAPASISVIEKAELKEKDVRDLADALDGVEGVTITGSASQATGSSGQDISIRGMPGQYTLILVDGKRVNTRETRTNGSAGFEQGWMPPVEAIERIEIVRGPMSSLYGSDAIGGVVNIITKRVTKNWKTNYRLESVIQEDSRSGNSIGSNIYSSGPLIKDKLAFTIWGNYFLRSEDEITDGFTKANNYNLAGKFNYNLNKDHHFILEYSKAQQVSTTHMGKSTEITANGNDSENNNNRNLYSLTHEGNWENVKSEMRVYHESAKRQTFNLTKNIPANPTETENFVGDVKFIIPTERHLLSVGAQWRKDDIKVNSYQGRRCKIATCDSSTPNDNTSYEAITGPIDLSVEHIAAFVEDEISLTDKLNFTAGLRLDNHNVYGNELVPRGYFVYQINPFWNLKTGVSKGYKAPSPRQILPDYALSSGGSRGGGAIAIMGNKDLKPETSINKEIGINFTNDKNLRFAVTYFRNDFKDKFTEVIRDDIDMQNRYPGAQIRQSVNVAEAVLQGLETSVNYGFSESLAMRLTYTLIDSEITKDPINNQTGRPIASTPQHSANFRLSKNVTDNIKAWGTLKYTDKQIYLGRANAEPTISPSYMTVDIGGTYNINETYSVGASVNNLTNKRLNYSEDNITIDGRNYWISFNGSF